MRYLRKQADLHPDIVTLTKEGTTEEGRDLMLITISDNSRADAAERKAIWIDSGLHLTDMYTVPERLLDDMSLNCRCRNPCKRMDRACRRLLRGRQTHRGLLLPREPDAERRRA